MVLFLQNEAFKLKLLLYFLAKSRNRRIKNKPERFIFPFKDNHFEFGVDEDPTLTSVSSVLPQHNNTLEFIPIDVVLLGSTRNCALPHFLAETKAYFSCIIFFNEDQALVLTIVN